MAKKTLLYNPVYQKQAHDPTSSSKVCWVFYWVKIYCYLPPDLTLLPPENLKMAFLPCNVTTDVKQPKTSNLPMLNSVKGGYLGFPMCFHLLAELRVFCIEATVEYNSCIIFNV